MRIRDGHTTRDSRLGNNSRLGAANVVDFGKLFLSRRRMRTHNCRLRARRSILLRLEELVVNSRRNILQPGQRLQSQRALIVLRIGDRGIG
jgi:hypothetical protein